MRLAAQQKKTAIHQCYSSRTSVINKHMRHNLPSTNQKQQQPPSHNFLPTKSLPLCHSMSLTSCLALLPLCCVSNLSLLFDILDTGALFLSVFCRGNKTTDKQVFQWMKMCSTTNHWTFEMQLSSILWKPHYSSQI